MPREAGAGSQRTIPTSSPIGGASRTLMPQTWTPRSRLRPPHSRMRIVGQGAWPGERARCLLHLADRIESAADALAQQQIFENGKLISEMGPGMSAVAAAGRFFAGLAETHSGTTVPPPRQGFTTFTLREPIGVVAAITPWNTPLGLLAWKLFPALAAGNTVVIKPSEVTPTSTLLLAELIRDAGIPDGVVNVVTGEPLRVRPWSRTLASPRSRLPDRRQPGRRLHRSRPAQRQSHAGARRQITQCHLCGCRAR